MANPSHLLSSDDGSCDELLLSYGEATINDGHE